MAFDGRQPLVLIDGTVGEAGHLSALLKQFEVVEAFGLDRDELALGRAGLNLAAFDQVMLRQRSYEIIPQLLTRASHQGHGALVLLDLGLGSHQLESGNRGFSFLKDKEDLDLRFDASEGLPAWQLIAESGTNVVTGWLKQYGEIRKARSWAAALCRAAGEGARTVGEFRTELPEAWRQQADAARLFQALRIAVNDELGRLERMLEETEQVLKQVSVLLLIISFHSLEDRIVKQTFRRWESPCSCPPSAPICVCGKVAQGIQVQRKVMRATDDEIARNSRSRSAKMRGFISQKLHAEMVH